MYEIFLSKEAHRVYERVSPDLVRRINYMAGSGNYLPGYVIANRQERRSNLQAREEIASAATAASQ